MTTAKELLGFRFNPDEFTLSAHGIAGPDVKREIQKAIQTLEKLEVFSSESQMPPDAGILYEQFMHLCERSQFDQCRIHFSGYKKSRKLSYILSYHPAKQLSIASTPYLKLATEILSKFWRDRMLVGLIQTLLTNWDSDYIDSLRELINEKINTLNTRRPKLLKLKEKSHYFVYKEGPHLLGVRLAQNHLPIESVWEWTGFEENLINTAFFAYFCVAYFKFHIKQSDEFNYIPSVIAFLEKNGNKSAAKQVLTELIFHADKQADSELQELIKKAAFQLVGDPENDAYWTPWEHATFDEKNRLKEAQQILNGWIVQQFIELFFDKLAMDAQRKNFWLKYLKHIQRFKIYGQPWMRNELAHDSRLAPFIEKRVGYLDGDLKQNALVILIKNYILIEFSYSGSAFYAYPTYQIDAPDLSLKRLAINQLKPKSIRFPSRTLIKKGPNEYDVIRGRYIQNYEMHESGKLGHNGDWQKRLATWLAEYIKI